MDLENSSVFGVKASNLKAGVQEFEDYKARRQSGVTAQPDLATRCKPTEFEGPAARNQKGSSGKIIFCSDFAQPPVI